MIAKKAEEKKMADIDYVLEEDLSDEDKEGYLDDTDVDYNQLANVS